MGKKSSNLDKQIKDVKIVSRLIFHGKPTKVKPSGKLYSRKKKDHPGIQPLLHNSQIDISTIVHNHKVSNL